MLNQHGWLRALRNLTRFKIPPHLRSRYRELSIEANDELKSRLIQWRQSAAGQPASDDDDLENHLFRRLDDNRRQVVPWLDAVRQLAGSKVLEIGCGTGSATVALAEQGASVTAIDIDPASIGVAEERCRLHGLTASFQVANAAEISEASGAFDFIIFYASLEHMTHSERLAAMTRTWQMLPAGGLWCVVETPNRLWYYDHHTAHLDFFMWLSDELAADYVRFSPRDDVRQLLDQATDRRLALRRAGRGVSFHEFDLALGRSADLKVISSMPLFYRQRDPALRLHWRLSPDYPFEKFLMSRCPHLHRGFLQPSLYVIIRKP